MISCSATQPDKATQLGAVDDSAAAPRTRLTELMLHASPDTTKIQRIDAIEVLVSLIGRIARRDLNGGIAESHVEPAEGGDRALDHGSDLRPFGDFAADSHRLMGGRSQPLRLRYAGPPL